MKRRISRLNPFGSPHHNLNKLIKSVDSTSPFKKGNRNKFNGNFSNILNKFNLKKFGGVTDFDNDGVKNKFDCNPFNTMRQDFTPLRDHDKAAKLSAAKRFGGKNLLNLKRIGQGRDRTVYALDKDKVLKVAKNPGGLTQNSMESALDWPVGQIKHYETGLDYAVMERAQPPGKAVNKMLKPLQKARDETRGVIIGYQRKHPDAVRADFFNSPHFDESGLDPSDFSSHDVNPPEFTAKRQWGEKDGKPVLIDAGALMGDELDKYRIKHFQAVANIDKSKDPPWQLEEWQEVQRQRALYQDKGKEKKLNVRVKTPEQYTAMADFMQWQDTNTIGGSSNQIIQMPIDKAWNMRAKQAYPGDMTPKREEYTMDKIRAGMKTGRFDPIETTPEDLQRGVLQDGKHRLIVAKEMGLTKVPVVVNKKAPASYDDKVTINKFSTPGGKLEITEYEDDTGAVSSLYVDEDHRRQGVATDLLNEAKYKYKQVHAQVSNVPSVKTHFKAGFRLDDKPDASMDETLEVFEKASTGPGSIGMTYKKGASEEKQEEWKNMSMAERNAERLAEPDKDGDRVPDEYDCDPDDTMRQDIVYHGTTPFAAMQIKKVGILTSNELKEAGEPYHTLSEKTIPDKTYFFKDRSKAEAWAEVATANSMFPNAKPTVVVADIPGDELFPDVEMEMGGAYYKEGSVFPSQIIDTYPVEEGRSVAEIRNLQQQLYGQVQGELLTSEDGREQMRTTDGKPAVDMDGNPIYKGDL